MPGGMPRGRPAPSRPAVQQSVPEIFCGTWEQPSAHVRRAEAGDAASLMQLAMASPWRSGLDGRFACAPPRPTTILGGQPAALLDCSRRQGGWPQVALVAAVDGVVYYADGILPTLPVMERTIGIESGRLQADAAAPPSGADSLMAARLAAQAFRSGDVGLYEQLMVAGTKANLAESYPSAEQAFRAAMALQQKVLGRDNPDTVNALMHVALQVSDQGRFAEATPLFAQADRLAPRANDRVAPARLLHYRALHAVNQRRNEEALGLLRQAEAAYAALLPLGALNRTLPPARRIAATQFGASRFGGGDSVPDQEILADPAQRSALIGAVETRRYQAIMLRDLGRLPESEAAMASAAKLAAAYTLRQPILTARLYRHRSHHGGDGGRNGGRASRPVPVIRRLHGGAAGNPPDRRYRPAPRGPAAPAGARRRGFAVVPECQRAAAGAADRHAARSGGTLPGSFRRRCRPERVRPAAGADRHVRARATGPGQLDEPANRAGDGPPGRERQGPPRG